MSPAVADVAVEVEAEPSASRVNPEAGMQGVARQTIIYGIGIAAGKLLGVMLLPVYTRLLTPADYGVIALVMMALDVAMIVAGAKLVQGIFRFYNKEETVGAANLVVSTAFVWLLMTFGAMGLAAFIVAPQLSALLFDDAGYAGVIRIASVTAGLTPAVLVPQAYFRMRDRADLYVAANVVTLVMSAILNVVLLLKGFGVRAMFISALTSTLVVGGATSWIMLRDVGIGMSRKALRDLNRYGMPLVATNIAAFLFTFGDRFVLQRIAGETGVGLYNFAYTFGFLMLTLGYAPFMETWQPRRFRVAMQEDRDELLSRGFIYVNVMLIAVATAMVLFIGDFFRIMVDEAFHPAAAMVPVILVAYVFHAWTNVQDIGIMVTERTGFHTLANWVSVGVAGIGYLTLIPRYQAWGAVLTALCTFGVRYVLIYSISQRLWPVRYEWSQVLKLVGLAAAASVTGQLLPDMPLYASVPVHVVLYALFVLTVWNSGILTDEDRQAIHARVARIVGMVRRVLPSRA